MPWRQIEKYREKIREKAELFVTWLNRRLDYNGGNGRGRATKNLRLNAPTTYQKPSLSKLKFVYRLSLTTATLFKLS